MWLTALGVVALALGFAGLRYAPAMIEAQREEGMAPVDADEIDDEDRVLITRVMGAVFAVAGVLLIGYGLSG